MNIGDESSLSHRDVAGSPAASLLIRIGPSDIGRITLLVAFVVVAHLLPWDSLRALNCTALVWLLQTSGFDVVVAGPTEFSAMGMAFRFVVSCTVIDALLGAVPLLWNWGRSGRGNLTYLGFFFVGIMGINLIRLWLGFVLLRLRVPWVIGHEVVAGFFYFGMLAWIVRERQNRLLDLRKP